MNEDRKNKRNTPTFDQISSPDLRDIMMNDLRRASERGEGALPVGAEEEMGLAKESISAFGQAERLKALPEVERNAEEGSSYKWRNW